MAQCSRVYVDSIGTEIILDTEVAITSATYLSIQVKKPDETTAEWVGTVFENTKVKYLLLAGDVDQTGEYALQVYVEMPVFIGRGCTEKMKVYENFD